MSSRKDHSPEHSPARGQGQVRSGASTNSDSSKTPASNAGDAARSGRPTFDSRGNAVWEWQTEETGKYSKDVSTQRLKKLEASDLSLEDTTAVKHLGSPGGPAKERGFNPYDRASVVKANSETDKNAAAPARKPIKDLKRYDEWLKMKKRMETQKDE